MLSDLIDEQDLARLLPDHDSITARAAGDPAAALHVAGANMAAEIHAYLQAVCDRHLATNSPEVATHAARLADHAQQLQAHHLDMLDRLAPA